LIFLEIGLVTLSPMNPVQLDTTQVATDTIQYVATTPWLNVHYPGWAAPSTCGLLTVIRSPPSGLQHVHFLRGGEQFCTDGPLETTHRGVLATTLRRLHRSGNIALVRTCNVGPSAMPKKQFLRECRFRPEFIAAMRAAFLKACEAPQVRDAGHGMTEVVAERILELADAGETIPERLCTGALHRLSH
jgi:hypothetical protein